MLPLASCARLLSFTALADLACLAFSVARRTASADAGWASLAVQRERCRRKLSRRRHCRPPATCLILCIWEQCHIGLRQRQVFWHDWCAILTRTIALPWLMMPQQPDELLHSVFAQLDHLAQADKNPKPESWRSSLHLTCRWLRHELFCWDRQPVGLLATSSAGQILSVHSPHLWSTSTTILNHFKPRLAALHSNLGLVSPFAPVWNTRVRLSLICCSFSLTH